MKRTRIAYMPLATYPEAVGDASVTAAACFAKSFDCILQVTTFSVNIPQIYSPISASLLDIPGLVLSAEEKSKAECHRLQGLVQEAAGARLKVECMRREVVLSAALDAAAREARCFDLAVLPWSDETVGAQDMAEAILFGSGRPTILVPPSSAPADIDHIAIAWDGSRVAARALGDALPLLPEGARISVLTVEDEKPFSEQNLASSLAALLEARGFNAAPVAITLGTRTIAEALQATAMAEGARMLAMGGFGHSRIRDFVMGGATKGIFRDLRLPVLLSH